MVTMATMVRTCLPGSTIWGSCVQSPHMSLQFIKEKHARRSSQLCATIGCLVEGGTSVENTPQWKWRLLISYDGTQYSGWQLQPRSTTVQQMVEDAVSKVTRCSREQLKVVAAGRTDTGVHAWGQVAHFVTPFCFDNLEPLHVSLNGILPPDIRIREIAPVHPDFHARHSARRKTYQYKAIVAPVMEPFQHNYAYHIRHRLNIAAMQEAASYFVGLHNFSAFANASSDSTMRSVVRELLRFSVVYTEPHLLFEVESKGFLYKQVRNMVGLLIEVGKEQQPPRIVQSILATEDRRELAKASPVAPPHGLYLMSVAYDNKLLEPLPNMPQASYGRWQRSSVTSLV